MFKNVQNNISRDFRGGLNNTKNLFLLQPGESPAAIDVRFEEGGSLSKRPGISSMNSVALERSGGFGLFDCGVFLESSITVTTGYSVVGGIDSATLAMLHLENKTDSSFYAYTFRTLGQVIFDSTTAKFGSSLFVNETGYLIAKTPGAVFDILAANNSQATIEAWVCRKTFSPGPLYYTSVFSLDAPPQGASGVANSIISLYHINSDGYTFRGFVFYHVHSGGVVQGKTSGFYCNDTNTWHHVAVVKNGTNLQFLYDGTSTEIQPFGALEYSYWAPGSGGLDLTLGAIWQGTEYKWPGWIDEFRFSNSARYFAGGASVPLYYAIPTVAFTTGVNVAAVTSLLYAEERRLIAASGSGLYYSKDIGKSFLTVQTDRAAARNHFSFVKNYIIDTNEDYETPQYWTGSAGVYFRDISTAAPLCKYSISHQGYFILLNQKDNPRGFYYVDENEMFSAAFSTFQFPTEKNDEITCAFELGRFLYVSTKYKVFRVEFTGTDPVWKYTQIKSWGYVPKTVKKINVPQMGEVIVGLDYSKRIRIFSGSNDEVISDKIEDSNGFTPFYLSNISDEHINLCWAENDLKAQVYRLFVSYGTVVNVIWPGGRFSPLFATSLPPTYANKEVVFDYRIGAFYANQNRNFGAGVMAQDTIGNLRMLVADYSGWIHQVDSGNTDNGTPIDEYYSSPLYFRRSPSRASKSARIEMFMAVTSSGTLFYEDRRDFVSPWSFRREFDLVSDLNAVQTSQTIDIPETVNAYQFKLSSSANTAEPWRLNFVDIAGFDLGIGKR